MSCTVFNAEAFDCHVLSPHVFPFWWQKWLGKIRALLPHVAEALALVNWMFSILCNGLVYSCARCFGSDGLVNSDTSVSLLSIAAS